MPNIIKLLTAQNCATSCAQARRLVIQGAVKIDGRTIIDTKAEIGKWNTIKIGRRATIRSEGVDTLTVILNLLRAELSRLEHEREWHDTGLPRGEDTEYNEGFDDGVCSAIGQSIERVNDIIREIKIAKITDRGDAPEAG